MKIYLVGGAVRDELLGIPHQEKDWVVVGATVEEMVSLGYRPVGKDFPVFLHPVTHEEYALARTERKVGKGYKGFTFNASPEVTLEEDLARRDLTINAMAKDLETNTIIDPFHGQKDLKEKILRHVSAAFVEDPVRILRIGRFSARYFEFKVAAETIQLMQEMVKQGEVQALVAERVWKEFERALSEPSPTRFFVVLEQCNAMPILFPNTLSLENLQKASKATNDTEIRFACLLNSLDEKGAQDLCERYRVPNPYRDLALLVIRFKKVYAQVNKLTSAEIVEFLQSVDAFRREERFKKLLHALEIMLNQKKESMLLQECFQATKEIKMDYNNLSGMQIAEKIKQARVKAIEPIVKRLTS